MVCGVLPGRGRCSAGRRRADRADQPLGSAAGQLPGGRREQPYTYLAPRSRGQRGQQRRSHGAVPVRVRPVLCTGHVGRCLVLGRRGVDDRRHLDVERLAAETGTAGRPPRWCRSISTTWQAEVVRPVQQLVGYDRVDLGPGERPHRGRSPCTRTRPRSPASPAIASSSPGASELRVGASQRGRPPLRSGLTSSVRRSRSWFRSCSCPDRDRKDLTR